ncbi:phosphoribosylamine--glycine ligase [Faecalispora anaeroviscerum]|uniref:phosphoribosylamine--glycine ligase n=1 Tax=Faecalispora anaeroviscerum TaxID=2991836 RepID=UPI0024BBC661|nr:phosphoribosylamine--glycine ligase [Faecalispora anaeroviscerum]
MKVLVIGGGGREHALVRKLKESPRLAKIWCAPGNGGIARDAECVDLKVTDLPGVLNFAKSNQVDLVVVAPDDPLAAGMVDVLEAEGIRAFGPRKNAAQIEASKVFSKDLMQKYKIPTAGYQVFTEPEAALAEIRRENSYPVVIKADGLALGKGVVIAQDYAEAEQAVRSMMEDKIFGESGSRIVLEEFLTGPEVSVLAFTDGKCVRPMVSSKDHKRALDNDQGANTGGMGTISPNPFYDDETARVCMETIFLPTIHAMNTEGRPFKGCLYFGLMLTPKGPRVIEYNARFGDPETQVVLPRLESDLIDIMDAVIDERLEEQEIEWSSQAAACVVMASGGYPAQYKKGLPISGLTEDGQVQGATVYHAGTALRGEEFVTNGGRVLGVTATGETLEKALEQAYRAVSGIHFEGAHYRRDIGKLPQA